MIQISKIHELKGKAKDRPKLGINIITRTNRGRM